MNGMGFDGSTNVRPEREDVPTWGGVLNQEAVLRLGYGSGMHPTVVRTTNPFRTLVATSFYFRQGCAQCHFHDPSPEQYVYNCFLVDLSGASVTDGRPLPFRPKSPWSKPAICKPKGA